MSNTQNNNSPIVHIGSSHFFRGHLLPLIAEAAPDLKVTAISLRSAETRNELQASNFDYDLVIRRCDGAVKNDRITNLNDILVHSDGLIPIVELLASPSTEIVTMTITKAAYTHTKNVYFSLTDGSFIDEKTDPTTAAVLAAALYQRWKNGVKPPILMSLDNGEGLSTLMKENILAYAAHIGADAELFLKWVSDNLIVVDTMVDRIVPNGPHFDQAKFLYGSSNGVNYLSPVFTEELPRPALVMGNIPNHPILEQLAQHPNVLNTTSVEKYVRMKVRMLNGAHFALGIVSRLAGYELGSTDQAMSNPVIKLFVEEYVAQMRVSLKAHELYNSINPNEYEAEVNSRLSHPHLSDPLDRLARDSLDKVSPRLLEPLSDLVSMRENHQLLDMVVVAWTRYLKNAAESRQLVSKTTNAKDSGFEIYDSKAESLGLLDHPPEYYDQVETLFANEILNPISPLSNSNGAKEAFDVAQTKFDELVNMILFCKDNPDITVDREQVVALLRSSPTDATALKPLSHPTEFITTHKDAAHIAIDTW